MSDDQLVAEYDRNADTTGTGTGLLRDELLRRESERLANAVERLTAWNVALVAAALIVSVVTLVMTITT